MMANIWPAVLLAGSMMLGDAHAGPATRPAGDRALPVVRAEAFEFPKEVGTVNAWTSITATRDNQIIAGLCRSNEPAYLVQFDGESRQFVSMVCVDEVIHDVGEWRIKQAKIHSQLFELSDGWVYGGTHLSEDNEWMDYPGGHWLRYDPRSHKMEDLGLAMAHEGLITIQADEQNGCLYAVTYPGAYLLRFDLASRKTQVLGKTSRDHQVSRVVFLLGRSTVVTNEVFSPASQPGGLYVLDTDTDRGQIVLPPVTRSKDGLYTQLAGSEGPRIYNYWLAGVTGPSRNIAYTTGSYSGHFISVHLRDRQDLVVRDHGLTIPDCARKDGHGPYSEGMCCVGDNVLFTVDVSDGGSASRDEERLLRYDPQSDTITPLGVIRTTQDQKVVGCAAMTWAPSGHIYFIANVPDLKPCVLLRIDLRGLGMQPKF